ncbi:MAG: RNA polymerase sigma factor [Deltaproteobacteria bacterium]|nr:RNA polymerase sigma factor [Deltaproteobacteria bacterium]
MSSQPAPSVVPDPSSDLDAITAVLAGHRQGFAVLVRRHNQAMFRACRAVLGNDTDAEDAVQVAWINAYRALATFRAESTFRTWVTRIAVNEASSRLRHRRRLSAIPIEETTMEQVSSPERDVQTSELSRLLEQQIDLLPEGMRTVLVLRDIIELDTAETAACLGIGEENVRVRLHRARQTLASSLLPMVIDHTAAPVWRFDGERCARVLAHVMGRIAADAR